MRRTCTRCHAHEWPRFRWCRTCWETFIDGATAGLIVGVILTLLGCLIAFAR